ncbi:MAG: ribbon-helix-helix domain-containing protein [Gammaproteobacteria bacterium]|nr:ribbon-helix-helix domain-containing protein [Gammaproteobacteria bacterium]
MVQGVVQGLSSTRSTRVADGLRSGFRARRCRRAGGVDKALRAYLGRRGRKKGDLSQFVEEALQARLFELTVQDAKERSPNMARPGAIVKVYKILYGP